MRLKTRKITTLSFGLLLLCTEFNFFLHPYPDPYTYSLSHYSFLDPSSFAPYWLFPLLKNSFFLFYCNSCNISSVKLRNSNELRNLTSVTSYRSGKPICECFEGYYGQLCSTHHVSGRYFNNTTTLSYYLIIESSFR